MRNSKKIIIKIRAVITHRSIHTTIVIIIICAAVYDNAVLAYLRTIGIVTNKMGT